MDLIARTAGISTPTLFRYFPTKAALLWHGMDESAESFRSLVEATPSDVPPARAIAEAYLAMLDADPARLAVIRARVAIIANDPAAAEASWTKFEEWRRLVTELLQARVHDADPLDADPHDTDPLDARIAGSMVWAGLWSALTAWAVSDESTPHRSVRVAARRLAALLGD